MYDGATPFALARSLIVEGTPVSSIFRHRDARANAFNIALSTRGSGGHSAPSGVTTGFRPPRLLAAESRLSRATASAGVRRSQV
jgi:hypothetical protein